MVSLNDTLKIKATLFFCFCSEELEASAAQGLPLVWKLILTNNTQHDSLERVSARRKGNTNQKNFKQIYIYIYIYICPACELNPMSQRREMNILDCTV